MRKDGYSVGVLIATASLLIGLAVTTSASLPEAQSGAFTLDTRMARVDTDNDGMLDAWEIANALDHLVDDAGDDPDGDTRTNLQEYDAGSNPHVRDWMGAGTALSGSFTLDTAVHRTDTDSDGMPDWWENLHGLINDVNDSALDPDRDGWGNIEEYNAGSNPNVSDLASTWSGISPVFTLATGGYPFSPGADSDSDNMPDWWEFKYGLQINIHDADVDFDHDGLSNLEEYDLGMNPSVNDVTGEHSEASPVFRLDTAGRAVDSDGDGMPDWWETAHGLDLDTDDSRDDIDNDGRTNLEEYDANSDPRVYEFPGLAHAVSPVFVLNTGGFPGGHALDSDHDGMPDWWETKHGLLNGTDDSEDDEDGDLIDNLREYLTGKDPNVFDAGDACTGLSPLFRLNTGGYPDGYSSDSDADGMPDWWEERYGLEIGVDDSAGNADGDGLTNGHEYRTGSDPRAFDHPIPHLDESNLFILDTGAKYIDVDTDGMPDWWEWVYFGAKQAATAGLDADGDGASNRDEYIGGTDPQNASSRFSIAATEVMANNPAPWSCVITWDTVPERLYKVFSHTNLTTAWPTNPVFQVEGDGNPKSYTNTFESAHARFFRITVDLMPGP